MTTIHHLAAWAGLMAVLLPLAGFIGFDIYPSVGGPVQTFGAAKAKNTVFYNNRVHRVVDQITWRALGKAGAYARVIARRMLSPSASRSRRGHPPNSHPPRMLLRRFMLWARVRGGQQVMIGPKLLSGAGVGLDPWGTVAVPGLLEKGGQVTDRRGERHTYAERPFMRPALAKTFERMDKFYDQARREVTIGAPRVL